MTKQNKGRKLFAVSATAALVASAIVPVASAAFNDDAQISSWAKDDVEALVELGYMQGLPNGNFDPKGTVTRAQAAQVIATALELAPEGSSEFSDVKAGAWYHDAIVSATEAGILSGVGGGKFNPAGNLTRAQAALLLVNTFGLEGSADLSQFSDANQVPAWANEALAIAVENGVIKGDSGKLKPNANITREEFASVFVRAAEAADTTEEPEEPTVEVQNAVAINENTVEVNFGKEIDADFIREAEQNGKYFVVYKEGETVRGTVIQSTSLNFTASGKTAEFVLASALQSGEKYYVALLDGPDAKVADVIESFGPVVLREAAAQPNIEVSAVSDKITLQFSTKMKNSALDVDNYQVYDAGGKLIGDLEDFVETTSAGEGEWVNAIEKKDVEFTLNKTATTKLLAGKTYKIKLTTNLETDANKTLSKDNLVLTINTPSLSDAAPKVSTARVTDADTIVLVFDKSVDLLNTSNLNSVVEIKTATGKKINATNITARTGSVDNEIVLDITRADVTADALDKAATYYVEIPANIVTNDVFPNAVNAATSSIKAVAQSNVAIRSVTAKFVTNAKDSTQADLVLQFDQRPELSSISVSDFEILDGADKYTGTGSAKAVKYLGSDSTGKTVVIEGINKGAFTFNGSNFTPKSNASYVVEVKAGSIAVDAFDGNGAVNPSKLSGTINGVSVGAPIVDRVTLESDEKIVIDFKEDIYSTVDINKIIVAGFEADANKFYTPKALTGNSNFTASVSGKSLTLTAKSGVKFVTGTEQIGSLSNIVEFKANAVVSRESQIAIKDTEVDTGVIANGKIGSVKVVDNAAPTLLFGSRVDENTVQYTFSEDITLTGDVAAQFKVGGAAEKSSVGASTGSAYANKLDVTFTSDWYSAADATDLLEVTTEYRTGSTNYINDVSGNKVANTNLKGVRSTTTESSGGGSGTPPTADETAAAIVTTKITALPATIALTDEAAVNAAKAAYDALTTAQKALVTNKAKLDAALAKIAELKGAGSTVTATNLLTTTTGLTFLDVIPGTVTVSFPAADLKAEYVNSTITVVVNGQEFATQLKSGKLIAVVNGFTKAQVEAGLTFKVVK